MSTIHSRQIEEVYEMPISAITRPLVSEVTEDKVCSLMGTLEEDPDAVPPIDVLWVKGTEGGNYYFSFGGCHRWEAHKRLGRETIKAKLVTSTPEVIRAHMGASCPAEFK